MEVVVDDDEYFMTGLSLGLGVNHNNIVPKKEKRIKVNYKANSLDLAFDDDDDDDDQAINPNNAKTSVCNNNEDGRKKLRLTKEQATMLENTFKLHTTLNSGQKQRLADQLNLKTRQIEVWFQNRRARTKLKQTEVDCELLKKRCQSLTDENRRLKKELHELRAVTSPLYNMSHSKDKILTMCCSCEKLVKHNE